MIVRHAKSADAMQLADIVLERAPDTRFAHIPVDRVRTSRMFAQAAQRSGGTHEGAAFLMVAEEDGQIQAFMLGTLSRIYMVFDGLAAQDVMLLGRRGVGARVLLDLFDHYVMWAAINPNVHEIGASWADTLPGSKGFCAAYERRGFELCAKTYRRAGNPHATREAA